MTVCTICRRLSATRPVGDPLYNARVCIDGLPCLTEWLSSLNGPEYDRVLAYVLALVTRTDTCIGRCYACGDMVFTVHSRVHIHDGTTALVLHHTCYITRLTQKLQEGIAT